MKQSPSETNRQLMKKFPDLEFTITMLNNSVLEIEVNRFNQMCSTTQITSNNEIRKEIQVKFYKAMVVLHRDLRFKL
jgi:hypothetical protein